MEAVNPNFLRSFKGETDAGNVKAFSTLGLLKQGHPSQLDAIHVAANRGDPEAQLALGHIARFEVTEFRAVPEPSAAAVVEDFGYEDVGGMEAVWAELDENIATNARVKGNYVSAHLIDGAEPKF